MGQNEPQPDLLPQGPFLKTIRITHHSNPIFFQGRPQDLEIFVNFPQDSVKYVSLFHGPGLNQPFQENILTELDQGHYKYRVHPDTYLDPVIYYFFVVTLTDYSLFATPVDTQGNIKPVKKTFIDPVQYYKWRREANR